MEWQKALYFSPPLVSRFTLVLRKMQHSPRLAHKALVTQATSPSFHKANCSLIQRPCPLCFCCFWQSFHKQFPSNSIFYPASCQQGFPKFMWAGDLRKLEISKTLYKHYTRVASFDLGKKQTQETIFFEVRSSPCSHQPVIENCLLQYGVKQPVKLTSLTIFFCPNIIWKEFNLLQMEQVNSQLSPSLSLTSWAFSRVSVLTHAVNLWQV